MEKSYSADEPAIVVEIVHSRRPMSLSSAVLPVQRTSRDYGAIIPQYQLEFVKRYRDNAFVPREEMQSIRIKVEARQVIP